MLIFMYCGWMYGIGWHYEAMKIRFYDLSIRLVCECTKGLKVNCNECISRASLHARWMSGW